MATYTKQCSKVGSFSYANNFILYVTLTERNVSINDNTSYVDYNVYCQSSGSGSISAKHLKYFSINGEEKTNTTEQVNVSSPNAYIPISNGSIGPIKHDDDGSKVISFEAKIEGATYGVSASLNDNFTLTTIQRKSEVSLSSSSVTLNNEVTIKTNRASSNFKHSLYWQVGNGVKNVIATNIADEYDWTVPLAVANSFPNSPTGTVNIICETYNGSTYIGTTTTNLYITVPSSIVPTISSISISGGLNGIYVEKMSTVTVKFVATGAYNSAISQYKVELLKGTAKLKESYGSTVTFDLNNLNISQDTDIKIRVYATDTRNRTTSQDKVINVKRYTAPTITSRSAYRCNSDGTANSSGTYLRIYWTYSTTSITGVTTATATVKYRQKGATTWTTATVANGGTVIVGSGEISTDYQYEVQFSITDGIAAKPAVVTDTILTGYTTVDYRAGGKGIAYGKVSEKDEFECNMETDFLKKIKRNGIELGIARYDDGLIDPNDTIDELIVTKHENVPIAGEFFYVKTLFYNSRHSSQAQIAIGYKTNRYFIRFFYLQWYAWTEIDAIRTYDRTVDFNTLTTTGIYINENTPTGNNRPFGLPGILEVFNNEGNILQRYSTINANWVFQRGYYNSQWGNWKKIGGSMLCVAYPSSRVTIQGDAWTSLKVPLNSTKSDTSSGSLSISDGGIKIGSNMNIVKVSASLCFYNYNAIGEVDLQILKNSQIVSQISIHTTKENQIICITTNPIAINVTKEDVINIAIVKNTEKDMTIINDNAATSLNVELIG